MIDNLLSKIIALPEVQQVAKLLSAGQGCSLSGLNGAVKTVFIAALGRVLPNQGSLAFLVSSRDEIREYRRTLNCYYPDYAMKELYPADSAKHYTDTKNHELQAERVAALRILHGEQQGIVFVTAEALLQKKPRPEQIILNSLEYAVGDKVEQRLVIEKLIEIGYERTQQVDAVGQCCLRGDILDVFPIGAERPMRLEWFDDTLDAMRSFDLNSQRSVANFQKLTIFPLEFMRADGEESVSAFEYLVPTTLLIVDEPNRFWESMLGFSTEQSPDGAKTLSVEEITQKLEAAPALAVAALPHNHLADYVQLAVPVRMAAAYNRNTELLAEDLRNWLADGVLPVIMMSTITKARGLAETLRGKGFRAEYKASDAELLQANTVSVISGELVGGFRFWNEKWVLVTENDIFGMQKRKRLHSKNAGVKIQYYSEIKAGDYVVHAINGIGRYIGVENMLVDGVHRDYLLLQYAGEERLYVPTDQVGMLHKYIGNEGQAPRLSKMGGRDWIRIQTKAQAAITLLAEELLRLYAQRKIVPGFAFEKDSPWQQEFEESFPFEETADQLQATAEIKADMEKPVPMDRLLCGDVGYGKTEVAIRAAFKAVMNSKQVALLVPTTVLAQQHYITFKERMSPYGIKVEMLSRFCTAKEQRRIIKEAEQGQIDIVIGTHRLLQADVMLPELGLFIIDEEQRFGVAQKEKIKKWKVGVDVLALSATPIPRTLHMALVNGRDMSVIESPPEDRLPVETYVAEYDSGMIKEAIERELRRGGRVYYVHNRVNGLETIAHTLRKLVPGIEIKVAHGQMPEEMLEDAVLAFYEGKCDVLLSTSIIENGLDVPLANTIIVDGADYFGLSQLYQMRGRVGRSSRLAYAYFVYRRNKSLSEIAEKRLQAIRDFTELGSGFKIAMRDLEIRGAGNILGAQQHGHIAGVGFAVYCEMLENTINALKNGQKIAAIEPDPVIEINVDAFIPNDYINDPRYKIELYRRFSEMDYNEKDDLFDEIADRFGEPPEELIALWRVAAIRSLCRKLRVRGAACKQGEIRITFDENPLIDAQALLRLMDAHKPYINFRSGSQAQLIYKTSKLKVDELTWLTNALLCLSGKNS